MCEFGRVLGQALQAAWISSCQQGSRNAGSVGPRDADPFPLMRSLHKSHPGPVGSNCAGSGMAQGSKFHFHRFQRIRHVKLRFDPESANENNQQAEEQEKAKDNAYANPIPTPAARIKEHKIRAAHKTTQRPRLLTRLRNGLSHGDASETPSSPCLFKFSAEAARAFRCNPGRDTGK